MATLWRLQGVLNKPSASDLIEHLTANAARQHGIIELQAEGNSDQNTNSSSVSNNRSKVNPVEQTDLNFRDQGDDEPKYNLPSQVNFLTFKNSYLEHVPPSEAYIQGEWIEIKHWNKALFEVIRHLVNNEGVSTQAIADALKPNIKVGREDGRSPIEGVNLSYADIRSPQVSWGCIEKLSFYWNIDVRVRFKWSENARVELRGLSYEIRTLPHQENGDD